MGFGDDITNQVALRSTKRPPTSCQKRQATKRARVVRSPPPACDDSRDSCSSVFQPDPAPAPTTHWEPQLLVLTEEERSLFQDVFGTVCNAEVLLGGESQEGSCPERPSPLAPRLTAADNFQGTGSPLAAPPSSPPDGSPQPEPPSPPPGGAESEEEWPAFSQGLEELDTDLLEEGNRLIEESLGASEELLDPTWTGPFVSLFEDEGGDEAGPQAAPAKAGGSSGSAYRESSRRFKVFRRLPTEHRRKAKRPEVSVPKLLEQIPAPADVQLERELMFLVSGETVSSSFPARVHEILVELCRLYPPESIVPFAWVPLASHRPDPKEPADPAYSAAYEQARRDGLLEPRVFALPYVWVLDKGVRDSRGKRPGPRILHALTKFFYSEALARLTAVDGSKKIAGGNLIGLTFRRQPTKRVFFVRRRESPSGTHLKAEQTYDLDRKSYTPESVVRGGLTVTEDAEHAGVFHLRPDGCDETAVVYFSA
jgi:hypothetical protein